MPRVLAHPVRPEVTYSTALSLTALPGDGGIRTRKVAILVADGVHGASIAGVIRALKDADAVPCVIADRLGAILTVDGIPLEETASLENSAPVVFDALVLPDGELGVAHLIQTPDVMDFVASQYRHGKTLLAFGASTVLLDQAGIDTVLASGVADPGVVVGDKRNVAASVAAFIDAVAKHRHAKRLLDLV